MSDTTTTTIPTGDLDDQAVTVPEPAAAGLDERLFEAAVGTLELLSIHLGRQLDLYRHLGQAGTAPELADRAGIDPRYAREWLEQQAVAGLIRTDATVTEWDNRPYWLDDEQRAVLVEAEDPAHVSPFAEMVVGIANAISDVEAAYRTGGGVPYTTYGKAFRDGQAAINRPAYASELADWVEAAPELADRLRSGGRIVDIGCGGGWSTIALARAFP
ncbi:MAG: SAM-dependent methyltransferase, partial [Actinomycetota bacterium]